LDHYEGFTKLTIELNQEAVRLFAEVLGSDDPQAIADDIHAILLSELEWNSSYTRVWRELKKPEWFVFPASDT